MALTLSLYSLLTVGPLDADAFLVVAFLVADVFFLGAARVVPSEAEDPVSASTLMAEYWRLLAALGGIFTFDLEKDGEQGKEEGEESKC